MYNRHPPFRVRAAPLAILGGSRGWLIELRGRTPVAALHRAVVIGARIPVVEMARLHLTSTRTSTGIAVGSKVRRPIHARLLGASFKQASLGLKAKIAELALKSPPADAGSSPPASHRSPQSKLGPDFRDHLGPKGADLALMLGSSIAAFDAANSGRGDARWRGLRARL